MRQRILVEIILSLTAATTAHAAILATDTFEAGDAGEYFVRFGDLQVAPPTGPFATNSLRFNSAGNQPDFYYDQIQYELASRPLQVRVDFDVFTRDFIGATNMLFTLLIDAPITHRLEFRPSGEIGIGNLRFGTFTDGQAIHVTSVFRIPENSYQIFFDNVLAYSSPLFSVEYVRSIRFAIGRESSAGAGPNTTAAAYLDNVVIESLVPVPAAAWLLGSALGVLGWMTRRVVKQRELCVDSF